MSEQRFIKFIPGLEAKFLRTKPFANALLQLIAERIAREDAPTLDLKKGECWIGDYEAIGATRQNFRSALALLIELGQVEILETCRAKRVTIYPTINPTIKGTKVRLLKSTIWDVNLIVANHLPNHQPNHKQEEEKKKEKKSIKEKISVYFDRKTSEFKNITPEYKQLLKVTFPNVDIDFELAKMKMHLLESKNIKKVGTNGFISHWLTNALLWKKTNSAKIYTLEPEPVMPINPHQRIDSIEEIYEDSR